MGWSLLRDVGNDSHCIYRISGRSGCNESLSTRIIVMNRVAAIYFFKRVKAWIKKHWQLLVGIAIPIILYAVTRRPPDLSEIVKRTREDYEKEIDSLSKNYEREIEQREEAQKRAIQVMREIEEKYREDKKDLDSKKRKEIQEILNKHQDDPDTITQQISELTGFKVKI